MEDMPPAPEAAPANLANGFDISPCENPHLRLTDPSAPSINTSPHCTFISEAPDSPFTGP